MFLLQHEKNLQLNLNLGASWLFIQDRRQSKEMLKWLTTETAYLQ